MYKIIFDKKTLKNTINIVSIVIILFFSVLSSNQLYANNCAIDSAIFDQKIDSLITKYNIPGAAIAIINSDSIRIDCYGYSNLNVKSKVSENTIFRLGSISKSYLAIAIMQLVEQGLIKLDDEIIDIIPQIEVKNKWQAHSPVKVIHLLEHTSSIDDVHFNEGYINICKQKPSLSEIFSINPKSRYVRWKPGEFTSYSNDAYSLLALIVEKVTGHEFEEYIQKYILDMIGANSTTYSRNETNDSLFAQGYTSDGSVFEFRPVLMRPSGGINSNIVDIAKFVQLLLNHGQYKNTTVIDLPTLNNMLYATSSIPAKEGYSVGYGSGFSSHFINGIKFYGHGGGLPDFNSIYLFNSELNLGIVILINKNSDYFSTMVKKVVSSLDINPESQDSNIDYSVEQFDIANIVGYYSQANYGISLDRFPNYFLAGQTVTYENDTLYIKEFQSDKESLIHVNGNAYKRINDSFTSIYFFRNSDEQMMLTQQGKEFYKKDSQWIAIFDRVFLLLCVVIILSFLLYIIICSILRTIYKLLKKEQNKYHFTPRLLPLLSIISVGVCLYSLSLWFSDYNSAGSISYASMSVFIFSILFSIFSLLSVWFCCININNKIKNRYEKIYLGIVSLTLLALSLFLYHFEIVGLRLWAY